MRNFTLVSSLIAILFFANFLSEAQVAINTDGSSPDAAAMLDVKSTTKGFLPPRMTTLQRTTLGSIAIAGLVVYDLTLKKLYYYDGTAWSDLSIGNLWTRNGALTYLTNTSDDVGIGTTTPGFIAGATRYLTLSTPGSSPNQIASLELKGASITTYSPVNRIDFLSHSGALGVQNIARIESRITGSQAEGELLFFTNGGTLSEKVRIDENGFVGVGTNAPARTLDVKGPFRTARLSSTSAGATLEFVGSNATDWAIGAWDGSARILSSTDEFVNSTDEYNLSTTAFRPWSNDTKYLGSGSAQWKNIYSIDGSFTGNVGIGTQTPIGKLQVHNSASSNTTMYITPMTTLSEDSSTVFFAEDHDATFGMYWTYDGVGNQMELWGKSSSNRYGPHLLIARDNGNMAIGNTLATGYKLSVGGKIICTELRVNAIADWPDYVFRKDYQILPVEKLGAYIEENGHLPNIPPASEVNKSGLDVGEMQRLMMEKIEELTLYIVEQQKQIQSLRNQLDKGNK